MLAQVVGVLGELERIGIQLDNGVHALGPLVEGLDPGEVELRQCYGGEFTAGHRRLELSDGRFVILGRYTVLPPGLGGEGRCRNNCNDYEFVWDFHCALCSWLPDQLLRVLKIAPADENTGKKPASICSRAEERS